MERVGSVGGVSGQCPDQDKVAEGWRCPLSRQPRQTHSIWVAVTERGQATSLTKRQGGGVSFRKRQFQNSKPPSPKGGAEGGTHTCLSYARNVVPQVRTGGGVFLGARGWGRGPTRRARKTLQVLGRN